MPVPQLSVLHQEGAGPGTAGGSTVSNSVPIQVILTQTDVGEEFSCGPRDLCLRLALGKRKHWPVCPNSWLCLLLTCLLFPGNGKSMPWFLLISLAVISQWGKAFGGGGAVTQFR